MFHRADNFFYIIDLPAGDRQVRDHPNRLGAPSWRDRFNRVKHRIREILRRLTTRLAASRFNPSRCDHIGHHWRLSYWGVQGPVMKCRVCEKFDWELGYPRQFYAKSDAKSAERNSAP